MIVEPDNGCLIYALFDPVKEVGILKQDSIELVKIANRLESIKRLVLCAEILDLTWEINQRFRSPPGYLVMDEPAFCDLRKISTEILVYQDPDPRRSHVWHSKIDRLWEYWRRLNCSDSKKP